MMPNVTRDVCKLNVPRLQFTRAYLEVDTGRSHFYDILQQMTLLYEITELLEIDTDASE